jgi:hypothetical protein
MDFGRFEEFWQRLARERFDAQELDTYEAETEGRRRWQGSAADAPVRAMICWAGLRGMVSAEPQTEDVSRIDG